MRPTLIGILITALWLVMMGLLVRDHLLPTPIGQDAEPFPQQRLAARWRDVHDVMVIRRGDQLLGAVRLNLTRAPNRETHTAVQRLQMRLAPGFEVNLRAIAILDEALDLDRFWVELDTPALDFTVRGQIVHEADGEALLFAMTGPQGERVMRRPLAESISLLDAIRPALFDAIDLEPGATYRIPSADLFGSLGVGDYVIEVQDYDIIETLGGQVATFRIAADFNGIRTTSWVDESGQLVRQHVWGDVFIERVSGVRPRDVLAEFPGIFEPITMPEIDLAHATNYTDWQESDIGPLSITRLLWESTP
jgi:hypothetical protein